MVFRSINDASAALRAENGREFFGAAIKVEYARGKSHVLGRLDGTGKVGELKKEGGGEATTLQQAIFGGVPGAGLPAIPPPVGGRVGEKEKGSRDASRGTSEGPQGVKRAREESDEEGAPMEEESDDDVEMEEESGDSD